MLSKEFLHALTNKISMFVEIVEKERKDIAAICKASRSDIEAFDFKVDSYSSFVRELDFFTEQELTQAIQAGQKLLSVLNRAEKRLAKVSKVKSKPIGKA
jgi:hypothetical protein